MVSTSPFKLKYLAGVVLLLVACNIPRDNVLDPGNEDSYRPKRILLEAFVNTENAFQYNQYMLSALDSIASLYCDRVEIVEYHRNTLEDSSQFHQNISDIIYEQYVEGVAGFKGVPHVFINGIDDYIQGASSIESALSRLQRVVDTRLSDNSTYTLEVNYEKTDHVIVPVIKLAKLGNQSAGHLKIRAILSCHIQDPYHKRVVVAGVKSNDIPQISAGEIHQETLPSMTFNGVASLQLIVYLTDASELQVFQCVSVDII